MTLYFLTGRRGNPLLECLCPIFFRQDGPTGGALHMSESLLLHFNRAGLETVPPTRTRATL